MQLVTPWSGMHCTSCKAITPHRKEVERSQLSDPVTYYKCDMCGEINFDNFTKKQKL